MAGHAFHLLGYGRRRETARGRVERHEALKHGWNLYAFGPMGGHSGVKAICAHNVCCFVCFVIYIDDVGSSFGISRNCCVARYLDEKSLMSINLLANKSRVCKRLLRY